MSSRLRIFGHDCGYMLPSFFSVLGIEVGREERVSACHAGRRTLDMFSSLGLFQSLPCPYKSSCTRTKCLFSHKPETQAPSYIIAVPDNPTPQQSTSSNVPAKRALPALARPSGLSSPSTSSSVEPPRKLQKTGSSQKPTAVPSAVQVNVRLLRLVVVLLC